MATRLYNNSLRPVFWIVLTLVAVWGWSLGGPFHFDDHSMLRDPRITGASGWWQVWQPLQTRPLTQFSFWLNYAVSGSNPLPFHLLNLLLHVANTLLAWRIAVRVLPSGALLAAMLFAVHPLQSEPVNYVFARSTLLMTLFCLLTVWCWLRERYVPTVVCFVFALLAKEECVTLPFALLLLQDWRRLPVGRRQIATVGTMLLAAGAAGIRTVLATQANPGSGAGFGAGVTPWSYLQAQGVVIWRYLRLTVVPYGLTVDTEIAMPPVWLSVVAWAGLLVLCWWAYRNGWRWLLVAFVLLIPSSSIFPAEDLAADRRMYLPVFALACFAAPWMANRRIASGAVLAVLGAISLHRTVAIWGSERSLWREAVEQSPGKVRARIQLARTMPVADAAQVLEGAAVVAPQDPDVPNELGLILLRNGKAAEALGAFGRALALEPGSAAVLNNRGAALQQLGQAKAAQADFLRALEKNPCVAGARRNYVLAGGDGGLLPPRPQACSGETQ